MQSRISRYCISFTHVFCLPLDSGIHFYSFRYSRTKKIDSLESERFERLGGLLSWSDLGRGSFSGHESAQDVVPLAVVFLFRVYTARGHRHHGVTRTFENATRAIEFLFTRIRFQVDYDDIHLRYLAYCTLASFARIDFLNNIGLPSASRFIVWRKYWQSAKELSRFLFQQMLIAHVVLNFLSIYNFVLNDRTQMKWKCDRIGKRCAAKTFTEIPLYQKRLSLFFAKAIQ